MIRHAVRSREVGRSPFRLNKRATATGNTATATPSRNQRVPNSPIFHVAMLLASGQLVLNRVGVEKLASKTRFPSGEFLPIRVFLLVVVAYALAIAGCALMLRNRTSRFRFCATAAR